MAKMETVKMDLKLGSEEKRILKNLTRSLDTLARAMQVNNPQKPKNDTIRLTEPVHLDEGGYTVGEMTSDEVAEALRKFNVRNTLGQY